MGGSRILIMDDDESILDVLKEMLADIGYDVDLTRNGEEAIKTVKMALDEGRPYGAAIIDLTIKGGMSGKDAIQNLLRIDPGLKAIVSSGFSDDPIMADPASYGFTDVLEKPFMIKDLEAKLSAVLKKD